MNPTAAQIVVQVREAGYELVSVEQSRANRWILLIKDAEGIAVLVLAQQRQLISSADVQDLAELLRLSQAPSGFLLAIGGRFSPEAQRTAAELRKPRILLCTALPPGGSSPRVTTLLEHAS